MDKEKLAEKISVYDDVVNAGLILPKKQKYTISDVRKLIKEGWRPDLALWIVQCSMCFYWKRDGKNSVGISKKLMSDKFFLACQAGLPI